MLDEQPSFGYYTVAGLLAMTEDTVPRIFQLKGWTRMCYRPTNTMCEDRRTRTVHERHRSCLFKRIPFDWQ